MHFLKVHSIGLKIYKTDKN